LNNNVSSAPAANLATTENTSTAYSMDAVLDFRLKIESPILAFPKSPGSFELLVANLGRITIQNECNSGYVVFKQGCHILEKSWIFFAVLENP